MSTRSKIPGWQPSAKGSVFLGCKALVRGHLDLPDDGSTAPSCGREGCQNPWMVRLLREAELSDGEIRSRLVGHFCEVCFASWLTAWGESLANRESF
jgi:hypothetical protein